MSKSKDAEPKAPANKSARKKPSKAPRRPHNAKRQAAWSTLDELVALVGKEPREVSLNGAVVKMSRAERRLRDEVDRALKGEVRALKLTLGLMIKHPNLMKKQRVFTQFIMPPIFRNL